MSYVAIKLTTGEEIFATLNGINSDEAVIISYPFRIQRIFVKASSRIESRLIFEPWMDYVGVEQVPISANHIVLCEPLIPQLCSLYESMKIQLTNREVVEEIQNDSAEEEVNNFKTKPILH